MKEVVQVKLENEMDLILAHKRAMKLSELSGLSLTAQTSLATAVSEVARCAIESGTDSKLVLGIDTHSGKKYLTAIIRDSARMSELYSEACTYAKRLIDDIEVKTNAKEVQIILKQQLNFPGTFTETKIDSFLNFFKDEPPLSSYDEIRRKNLMLQDLADKIKESEHDYRTLTDSLPLLMFSLSDSSVITYTNKWLQDFFGSTPIELKNAKWKRFLHVDDYPGFSAELDSALKQRVPFNGQFRFLEKASGNYLWHIFSVIPLKNEKGSLVRWIGFMVDIHAQKLVEQTLKDNYALKESQRQLQNEQKDLELKIRELNRSNYELEQFAHLASHDLQEPLRKLLYYSDVLKTKYTRVIDIPGVKILNKMSDAATRMRLLITELLNYSQLQQNDTAFESVELNLLMRDIIEDFEVSIKEKKATLTVSEMPKIIGNSMKLRQLFRNIISNSLKYSRTDTPPEIKIERLLSDDGLTIIIRDNGIGFDERYKDKIFGLFQRLHSNEKYPGTGIGLSACKKIVELHGGRITAYSKINEGATFEVTLPKNLTQL